jgi:myo-inositol-1(or 4)-monophosphatase
VLTSIADIRRDGSAATELCFVASGRLDGFLEHGLQRWDTSAGSLIVEEAGGKFGRLHGDDGITYFASNPHIYDQFTMLIVRSSTGAMPTTQRNIT